MADRLTSSGMARSVGTDGPSREALFLGGLWAALFFLLLWNARPLVAYSGDEVTDYAANSVLVQSAKHLTLTLGNHSRLGFHHPGPAFLYVLAAGEWLFHDRLGLVSPVGGQLVAVSVAEAAWICGGAFALRSLDLSRLETSAALAVSAAALAQTAPLAFFSLWFPYLYVMPFLCFALALAGALAGSGPCRPLGAFAAGFLVNGHVSFVGVCGVMVVVALGARAVEGARGAPLDRWTWSAAAIVAAFLLPLVWREIHHRPGPIEQYLGFARANQHHALSDGVAMIERQWLLAPVCAALAFAGQSVLCARMSRRALRAILVSLTAASIAAVYYATVGVDDLSQNYVVIFYLAVPALLVGTGGVAAARACPPHVRAPALLAGAVVAGILWTMRAHPALDPNYASPDVRALDVALSDVAGPGPALDLGPGEAVLARVVGVEALRLRLGEKPFCIDRGWQIFFTEAARCGPADAARPHVLVDVPQPGREPSAVVGPLALYRE